MMPNPHDREPAQPPPGERASAPVILDRPVYHWYHKIWAVLLITFCLEIGLFLTVFPWTTYWEINYFSQLLPGWRVLWYNAYLRGAVSGLGVLNLYIALAEIFRLRRFARRDYR
jgi:NhaP-type Na+/H+ or K+/H+ antiporter